jgi:hypothetical protein
MSRRSEREIIDGGDGARVIDLEGDRGGAGDALASVARIGEDAFDEGE